MELQISNILIPETIISEPGILKIADIGANKIPDQ